MNIRADIRGMYGMHAPTDSEAEQLLYYFDYNCRHSRSAASRSSTLFWILGLFLLGGGGSMFAKNLPAAIVMMLLGLGSFALAFYFVREKRKSSNLLNVIRARRYTVLEGVVHEMRSDSGLAAGTAEVQFLSNDGQLLDQWHLVRKQDVAPGTPLLLVYAQYQDAGGRTLALTRALTPHMLTEKGRKERLHYAPDYLPL